MSQRRTPVTARRFAEPELFPPNSDPGSTLALWRAIRETRRPRRTHGGRIAVAGIALLALLLAVVTPVILVALLGYFVVWLCFVGTLFTATVIVDLARSWWQRAWTMDRLDRRVLGYPGR